MLLEYDMIKASKSKNRVDRRGQADFVQVRPDLDVVEAVVLTWKCPKMDRQLKSFLGFANYHREFIKGYADKVYPMQRLMRSKGKKLEWNERFQGAFENINRKLCVGPVLGMSTEKARTFSILMLQWQPVPEYCIRNKNGMG